MLFGGSETEAEEVVAEKAKECGSPLRVTDRSRLRVTRADLSGTEFTCGDKGPYTVSLLGAYQPQNAANVLEAVEILRENGVEISEEAVETGLASAEWHGRFELVSKEPCVIFDGSHNPDGVAYIAESLEKYFPGRKAVLLMGVMADKDYAKYPDMLGGVTEEIFTVCPDNPRALNERKLAECFAEKGIKATAYGDFGEGVAAALACAEQKGLPLVALGTLYMYAGFTEALRRAM